MPVTAASAATCGLAEVSPYVQSGLGYTRITYQNCNNYSVKVTLSLSNGTFLYSWISPRGSKTWIYGAVVGVTNVKVTV